MPTQFHVVVREVGKKVGAFRSASAGASANNDYLTLPLTATLIESPLWTLGKLYDLVADAHSNLAWAIASCQDANGIGNHPWRVHFRDSSSPLNNTDPMPTVGASGKTIIGAFGRPHAAADTSRLLIPASLERVSTFFAGAGYTNTGIHFFYAISGGTFYTTAGSGVFDCCSYERSDVAALISSNGSFGTGAASRTVPDVLAPALVAGAIAMAPIEGEMLEMVGPFAAYYAEVLKRIAGGGVILPSLPILQGAA